MNSLETINGSIVSDQLLHILSNRDFENDPESARIIDGHPLLKTSNLIGSLSIAATDPDLIHIDVFHKVACGSRSSLPLSTTSICMFNNELLKITVQPDIKYDVATHFSDVIYAKEAYLPQSLLEEFVRTKGQRVVQKFLFLNDAPELVDFIHVTHENC